MYKMILADDEILFREYLQAVLPWADFGIQVEGVFANSQEVLAHFQTATADLALLDINMPGESGMDLAQLLLAQHKHLKIIFISGYSEFTYVHRALKMGAVDYILKPFTKQELTKAIERTLLSIEKEKKQLFVDCFETLLREQNSPADMQMLCQFQKRYFEGCLFSVALFELIDVHLHYKVNRKEIYDAFCAELLVQGISLIVLGEVKPVFVFYYKEAFQENLMPCLEKLLQSMEQTFHVHAILTVSNRTNDLFELGVLYNNAHSIHPDVKFESLSRMIVYSTTFKKRSEHLADKIENYINKNYWDGELSIAGIAKEFFLDPSHIRRVFFQSKGMKISHYIRQVRMETAVRLVKENKYSIAKIAEMCGYNEQAYFTKCFRQFTGESPSQFSNK